MEPGGDINVILYFEKYSGVNLMRLNADLEEFIAARTRPVELAWRKTSSP